MDNSRVLFTFLRFFRSFSGSRMAGAEDLPYMYVRHGQICYADRHVFKAHKLLQGLEIPSILKDVDREAVPQDLRRHAVADADLFAVVL